MRKLLEACGRTAGQQCAVCHDRLLIITAPLRDRVPDEGTERPQLVELAPDAGESLLQVAFVSRASSVLVIHPALQKTMHEAQLGREEARELRELVNRPQQSLHLPRTALGCRQSPRELFRDEFQVHAEEPQLHMHRARRRSTCPPPRGGKRQKSLLNWVPIHPLSKNETLQKTKPCKTLQTRPCK
jgi:hypothetical protein